MTRWISIRGARTHNLKNISLDLPRESLVVITGLSGSGKSSLAFDTLYAEGQRRYVESLSTYARQFLQLMEKPDVDSVDGLSPAISIEQKTTSKNPRSTVGTVTEIYDYLRLLFARVGVPHSPTTGLPIEAQSITQMIDRLIALPVTTRCYLLAPIVRGRKGEYKKDLQEFHRRGFQRALIDGNLVELDQIPELNKKTKHDISIVIDRFTIPETSTEADDEAWRQRIADSLQTALDLSDGIAMIQRLDTNEILTFSSKFSCPVSGFTLTDIEPRLFSFNSPYGACPVCDGLGGETRFDSMLVIPDPRKSLFEGAIAPWGDIPQKPRPGQPKDYYRQLLISLASHLNFSLNTPFEDLSDHVKKILLDGSGSEIIPITLDDGEGERIRNKPFEGILSSLKRRFNDAKDDLVRENLSPYQSEHPCSACSGKRLKPEALCVKITNLDIADMCRHTIDDLLSIFERLSLSSHHQKIGERILREIRSRLEFLQQVGLGYLTLSRTAGTLSGGESQRIRLASQVGSGLTGVLYVLDEPSIGLHQRDNDRLLETLKRLRDLGNTVVVVEHDEDAIRCADYVVDMGPGAGTRGGSIVAEGSPDQICAHPESLTGQYLTGKICVDMPKTRRRRNADRVLKLFDASSNNLKKITTEFPLGLFVCVTGVSGGGKSTLVIETLYKALSRHFSGGREVPGSFSKIEGLEYIDKVIDIDQSPIGRTPRSNPATYVGCFTAIREWFAALPEAQARGYKAGRFSFNVKGGRCETCHGDGVIQIEMHFLADLYVTCETCKGKRYNAQTLDIRYKSKNIADILDMTVDEAVVFFENHASLREKFQCLQDVGLGYIHVGQQATTLSGGEAQRIKLSKELSKRSTGKTLYILDEPTTGLHFEDVRKLLNILHRLVDQGNTVIVIEHNLDMIKTADWILDLGPEGGDKGGILVAAGTPEDVMQCATSYTGKYLKKHIENAPDPSQAL